jgi:NAD(P)-dependent dehydrogenase (short-subunit alcohol dehydrogenase family)
MNKFALVTGISLGIGKSIALALAHDGYSLILCYRRHKSPAAQVAQEIRKLGQKAYLFKVDISDSKQLTHLFTQVRRITPRLDLLVNNAGSDYGYLLESYKLNEIREILDSNLFGTIAMTKLAIPFLKSSRNPSVINISSRMGGPTTIPTISAYGPAKAGIIKFTQCAALELAKYRIRVNSISPGMTDTPLGRSTYSDLDFKQTAVKNPRGRICQPQDVADLVSFLASPKADYINGEDILLTGGSHLS